MAVRITAIRQSGGTSHEHIVHLWWTDAATGEGGNNTRAQVVRWIEDQDGKAYVDDRFGHRVDVEVVTPRHGSKYLRTRKDGIWTDNLLALPRR